MKLVPVRVEVEAGANTYRSPSLSLPAVLSVGPFEISVTGEPTRRLQWQVANTADAAFDVMAVRLVFDLIETTQPIFMFRHGYQSWSSSGPAVLGVDVDPSTLANLEFIQAVHHADQRTVPSGELRSEWITVVADARGDCLMAGFDAGSSHDVTFRLSPPEGAAAELKVEAYLGGATMPAGTKRSLHGVTFEQFEVEEVGARLGRWSRSTGVRSGARVDSRHFAGWCSWYQYFHDVTEHDIARNLALSSDWPFDLFLLDDGYQRSIGDWITTNAKFPAGFDGLAQMMKSSGRIPGIWLAPFLCAPDSLFFSEHPGWVASYETRSGNLKPLRTWWEPEWGGGEEGLMYGLDTTNPEALDYLESLAETLASAGYGFLKLDFTFSPSVRGSYADPTKTPAERVRAGFEALRRGAGDDTVILGCGVPLSNVVGLVDTVRIGQDVAPLWEAPGEEEVVRGYLDVQPATKMACASTMARAFMHRGLWSNDPDCIMLRRTGTSMSEEAARTWTDVAAMAGGVVLLSDDLSLLSKQDQQRFEDIVALGRECDAAARSDSVTSTGLVDSQHPIRLEAGSRVLSVDLESGHSSFD